MTFLQSAGSPHHSYTTPTPLLHREQGIVLELVNLVEGSPGLRGLGVHKHLRGEHGAIAPSRRCRTRQHSLLVALNVPVRQRERLPSPQARRRVE
eukprot:1567006-Prymnesium_polylepis.2